LKAELRLATEAFERRSSGTERTLDNVEDIEVLERHLEEALGELRAKREALQGEPPHEGE
jgi:hypothetical protein